MRIFRFRWRIFLGICFKNYLEESILEITNNGWNSIEEVEPDEIDLKMIQEIQNDPDCRIFE